MACGCVSTGSHPRAPVITDEDIARIDSPITLEVRLPFKQSSATLAQLRDQRDDQRQFFSEYRVHYDDTFTITVMDHPEWTTGVTVLRDGKVYFGFLGRSLDVYGKTFDEIIEMVIYGDPPRKPCPNCGYFYARHVDACPACEAAPADVAGTAGVVLTATAREEIQRLGGVVAPEARPFRPVAGLAGESWVALCERGIVGLRVDLDSASADRMWSRNLGRTVIEKTALGATALPNPLPVRLARRWVLLDLRTGLITPASAAQAGQFQPAELPVSPEPNGLNVFFANPRVKIENIVQATNSYTVNVLGAVNAPGLVKIHNGSRLWDAISAAGGPVVANRLTQPTSEDAPIDPTVDWARAVLMRQAQFLPKRTIPPDVQPTDLVRLDIDFLRLADGDPDQNIPLFPGDTIYIPEFAGIAAAVTVIGEVKIPGLIYFRGRIDLMTALARSGWLNEERALYSAIYLVRNSFADTNTREIYRLNAVAVAKGQARNVLLRDGDIIYVNTDSITDITDVMSKVVNILGGSTVPLATYRTWETLIRGR